MVYRILFNPLAGNGNGVSNHRVLCEKISDGQTVSYDVTNKADMKRFFEETAPEDAVVVCGGDGTLNHYVNNEKLMDLENRVYYYATGSGNDFLKDINRTPSEGMVEITEYLAGLPSVTVNGKTSRFINGIGYGIDGYCCEVGDRQRQESPGKKINYTAIAIKGLLFHFKPVDAELTVDGELHKVSKAWLVPTMYGRCYGGGMMPTPEQDRKSAEGKVSVLVFAGGGKLKTLAAFPSIFSGEHVKKYPDMCSIYTGHEVKVKFSRPCALQADGETVLNVTEYSVKSVPKQKKGA